MLVSLLYPVSAGGPGPGSPPASPTSRCWGRSLHGPSCPCGSHRSRTCLYVHTRTHVHVTHSIVYGGSAHGHRLIEASVPVGREGWPVAGQVPASPGSTLPRMIPITLDEFFSLAKLKTSSFTSLKPRDGSGENLVCLDIPYLVVLK